MKIQIISLVSVWLLSVGSVQAQAVGVCPPGSAEAVLDIGQVRARILNNGNLFDPFVASTSPEFRFEIPKGSGLDVLRTANLWVGGYIGDSLHVSAARYGSFSYAPGPLSAQVSAAACASHDQLASLYYEDIERYNRFGDVSDRLHAWPWQAGAPVIDGDGDPSNYNLAGGDRPAILGDQSIWWVMNDAITEWPVIWRKAPVQMQVEGTAFGFDAEGALGHSLFIRYQLRYRGERPLERAYVGLFVHGIMGNWDSQYFGSDTTLGMGYFYKPDNHDEFGYGDAPPALGVSFLTGPQALPDRRDNDRDGDVDEAGEQLRATNVSYFNSGGNVQSDPQELVEYYYYMQSRWRDGQPFIYGNDARRSSGKPIAFVLPGDPVTGAFWSERNIDNAGTENTPADRRFVISAGPFNMEPGETEELTVAFVWSRGDSHLDSVRKLRENMAYVQSQTERIIQPSLKTVGHVPEEALGYHRNFPNPFQRQTTIQYSLDRPQHVQLTVYDLLGREIETLVDAQHDAGMHEVVFDARNLTAGAYLYRLQIGLAVATETMMVMK